MQNDRKIPGYVHYRLKTWPQFNNNLLQHKLFGKYVADNARAKYAVDSITRRSQDLQTRMALLYGYIVSTYKWNGEYSMYATRSFEDFLHRKEGSSAELNLLLVDVLRKAGIKADPLLVRTNDLGAPETMYPVRHQFNHVIAVAEINGEQVLLDATSGNANVRMLNHKDIDTQGWIVSETSPGWVEIFSPKGNSPDEMETMFNL
jgi:transglutaminase-like putative cysteine protease